MRWPLKTNLKRDCDEKFSSTSSSLSSLTKKIQNIEEKVEGAKEAVFDNLDNLLEVTNKNSDQMKNDIQILSNEMNSSFGNFDNKFLTLKNNLIEGKDIFIQKISKIDEKLQKACNNLHENLNQMQIEETTTAEEEKTTTITTATTSSTTASLCEEGWVAYQNNMCYRLFSTKKSANEAEAHCKSLSAEVNHPLFY